MGDDPENLVLVYLRRLDQRTQAHGEILQEILDRLTALDRSQAQGRAVQAADAAYAAAQSARIDRALERRLDLVSD